MIRYDKNEKFHGLCHHIKIKRHLSAIINAMISRENDDVIICIIDISLFDCVVLLWSIPVEVPLTP